MNNKVISLILLGFGVGFIVLAFLIGSIVSLGVVLLGSSFIHLSRDVEKGFNKYLFAKATIYLTVDLLLILHLSKIIHLEASLFYPLLLLLFAPVLYIEIINRRKQSKSKLQ